jgi:hypothetical protein
MNGRRWAWAAGIAALVILLGWAMFSALGRRLAEPTPDAEIVTPGRRLRSGYRQGIPARNPDTIELFTGTNH